MSYGLLAATVLQTIFIFIFVFILTPFRKPFKQSLAAFGGLLTVLCLVCAYLVTRYGMIFLYQYGFGLVGVPMFLSVYLLSSAKGFRFIFIALTAALFHQMFCTTLMVIRVFDGGYTPLYFLLNFLLFGALMLCGWRMRSDFHQIVFTYHYEFCCLTPILILLFGLMRLFTPITAQNRVDIDLFHLSLLIYLLTLLIFLYVAVNFRSMSKRLRSEREALALRHQIDEAQEHISLLQGFQKKTDLYHHDLRHHLGLIREFLDRGHLDDLRDYLDEIQNEMSSINPMRYCQNEAANLLISSFATKAQALGIVFRADILLPHLLPIGNTELCALLSNALENAVEAVEAASDLPADQKREVVLSIKMVSGKLLISVENPYTGTVQMENGLPQVSDSEHGFGTKSMVSIVEKHNGLYSFHAEDNIFTVRIVI